MTEKGKNIIITRKIRQIDGCSLLGLDYFPRGLAKKVYPVH